MRLLLMFSNKGNGAALHAFFSIAYKRGDHAVKIALNSDVFVDGSVDTGCGEKLACASGEYIGLALAKKLSCFVTLLMSSFGIAAIVLFSASTATLKLS